MASVIITPHVNDTTLMAFSAPLHAMPANHMLATLAAYLRVLASRITTYTVLLVFSVRSTLPVDSDLRSGCVIPRMHTTLLVYVSSDLTYHCALHAGICSIDPACSWRCLQQHARHTLGVEHIRRDAAPVGRFAQCWCCAHHATEVTEQRPRQPHTPQCEPSPANELPVLTLPTCVLPAPPAPLYVFERTGSSNPLPTCLPRTLAGQKLPSLSSD